MVTIVIAAVILVLALPAFRGVILGNRIATAVNELSTSISIARTEAIKANSTARVKATDYSKGWMEGYSVSLDTNGDGTYDRTLRSIDPLDENSITTFANTTSTVVFNSLGGLGTSLYPSTASSITFTLNHPGAFGRELTVNMSGTTSVCAFESKSSTSCP